MKVLVLSIVALLPMLAVSEINKGFGHCVSRLPGINNRNTEGSAANMDRMAEKGTLAVVGWDPRGGEQATSCVKLTLDRGGSRYTLTYKDSNGVLQEHAGDLGETVIPPREIPILDGYSHFTLSGLPGDFFNGGNLFVRYAGADEFVVDACNTRTTVFPPSIIDYLTHYTLVPLSHAVDNKACGCDDWSA